MRQRRTAQSTKSGTLTNSTEKKPVQPNVLDVAVGAITEEDLALDRELERLANETPPEFSEGSSENVLKVLKDDKECLSDFVEDYKPAATVAELESQMHQAMSVGADSVEVTPQIFQLYCGPDTGKNPNWSAKFFHYKNVKAYLQGKTAEVKKANSLSIEQKVFGGG